MVYTIHNNVALVILGVKNSSSVSFYGYQLMLRHVQTGRSFLSPKVIATMEASLTIIEA
jgi:hypothetical protein